MTTIYIDESGHSGDLIGSGRDYDFQSQPFFVLAGVGLEESCGWEKRIADLRKHHHIYPGELKSKSLTSKQRFSADIVKSFLDQRAPLFVELVDKRYFICMYITTFQLLPPCLGDQDSRKLNFIKNIVTEFLYYHGSSQVLDTFVASCTSPGDSTLLASFASLREMATRSHYKGVAKDIARMLFSIIETAEAAWIDQSSTEKRWLNFLPPPDLNRNDKQFWMLPNLTSFTNLYARLNLYYRRRLAGVSLVHDQQIQMEDILHDGKKTSENLWSSSTGAPYTPHSDYQFEEEASLEFAESHEVLGLQLADIVAGATMRFFRDVEAGKQVNSELQAAMMRLISETDEVTGWGLSQVVPTGMVR